ncbi:hypothetical protein [Streptacidiphilus carbonis]|uniref:hypothetical protein n=1 Tax=Streptacidiphilus carbonis TaxID=105422 RepID=UPI000AE69A31|nr:hypothetical protein [Streptacidiphilus carbonis]
MPMVKVTLFQEPIEVPDDEVPVLRAQGLLVEEPAETPAKAVKAQPRKDEQQ